MPKTKPATLTSSVTNRAGGRKIDTWILRMDDPMNKAKPLQVEFEVSLLANMEFVVNTSDIAKDRWQPLQGKVLAELREQAETAANDEFTLRLGLEWSAWLEVRVEQASNYDLRKAKDGGAAQAHVSYTPIPRAQTQDGRAFTLSEHSGVLIPFPTDVEALPEGSEGRTHQPENPKQMAKMRDSDRLHFRISNMDRRETNVQFTYLPDTPENRTGLDAIIHGINTVNLRLQQFLHPTQITRTLARAAQAGPALLTGPAPEDPPRPKGPGR